MRGIPMGKQMPKVEMEVSIEEGSPEEGLMKIGKAMDDSEDEVYMMASPDTSAVSVAGLNTIVDALNAVLPLFGVVEEYPKFSVGVPSLPPAFMKQLAMVSEAAKGAGLDEMELDFSKIVDDRAAKMAAGLLRALSANTSFKRFLRSERPPGAAPMEAPPMGTMPSPKGDMMSSGAGDEEMMMGRMS